MVVVVVVVVAVVVVVFIVVVVVVIVVVIVVVVVIVAFGGSSTRKLSQIFLDAKRFRFFVRPLRKKIRHNLEVLVSRAMCLKRPLIIQ